METLKELLNHHALEYGDKTAFIGASSRCTFRELNERINRLNNALTALDVRQGDRVGVLAYNCPQVFEVLGLAKAGRIGVPLNFRSVGREMTYLIQNSGINSLVVEREFVPLIESIRGEIPNVRNYLCLDASMPGMLNYEELLSHASPAEPQEEVKSDDPCIIFYTSGTTGRPKGAVHTHKSMLYEANIPGRDLSPADVALCVMPFFHVGGCAAHLFPAFNAGATLVTMQKFDETAVLEMIAKHRVTYVYLVPAMILRVLEHPRLKEFDLASLRTVAYTGAPIPIEVLKKGIACFGRVFIQFLGQTETLDMTVLPKQEHKLEGTAKELRRLESTGRPPYPGELRLVDDHGQDVPLGQVGEIIAKSPRCMREYWEMPEATAETIVDGWLHTGDLARMDQDGYVYIVDRKKDMIISGAENIYSREVEEVLYMHPAVLEAAVIGVPDDKWGEAVKAIVVFRPGARATEQEIIEFCRANLASYKKPRSVEFWDSLPKTGSGKIMKNEMREKYWQGHTRRVH